MTISHYWRLRGRGWRIGGYVFLGALLSSVLLISCTNPFGGGGGAGQSSSPTPSSLALAKLKWCSQPFIVFRDEHATTTATPATGATPTATATHSATPTATTTTTPAAGTPTPATLTEWSQVQPLLGFKVYLPATLPGGTCLVSVSGTVHDPIFGGSFTIGYLLPDHSALSFSEAPQGSNSLTFQCTQSNGTAQRSIVAATATTTPKASPSATGQPYEVCSGVKGTTNIVFSAQGSQSYLTRLYNQLQPDVNWLPAS